MQHCWVQDISLCMCDENADGPDGFSDAAVGVLHVTCERRVPGAFGCMSARPTGALPKMRHSLTHTHTHTRTLA